MGVYVYLIFAFSIIPGLASACYIYDYAMLILTKKEKYLDAIKSKDEMLVQYPFIGLIGLAVGIYILYDCFFSGKQYDLDVSAKILNLCCAFCEILCFLKAAHLYIDNKIK